MLLFCCKVSIIGETQYGKAKKKIKLIESIRKLNDKLGVDKEN